MKKIFLILFLLFTVIVSQEDNQRFLSILNYFELSGFKYITTIDDTVVWEETGKCTQSYPGTCFFQELKIISSEKFILHHISRSGGFDSFPADSTVTFKDSGKVVFVGIDSVKLQSTHRSDN